MEKWKPVVGYEGIYEVSDSGRVRTDSRASSVHKRYRPGTVLKPNEASNGYLHVPLNRKGKKLPTIHSLVLTAFKGPKPAGQESRHIDGNNKNNKAKNLAWGTRKQNASDRITHGTSLNGTRHPLSKLTENQVLEIRQMWERGSTQAFLAVNFRISKSNVRSILKRRTWTHV